MFRCLIYSKWKVPFSVVLYLSAKTRFFSELPYLPVLGVKIKQLLDLFWLFFKIDLCPAIFDDISLKNNQPDISLKNNQYTYCPRCIFSLKTSNSPKQLFPVYYVVMCRIWISVDYDEEAWGIEVPQNRQNHPKHAFFNFFLISKSSFWYGF